MKFTSKLYLLPIVCGTLTIPAFGSDNAGNRLTPAPTESIQTNGNVPIVPAVERIPFGRVQSASTETFQPIAWYKSKHWWKRNAPIVGGAGGGALIGGLAGGGVGAVIGGAAGAGGGALYKHYKGHSHHRTMEYKTNTPPATQHAPARK